MNNETYEIMGLSVQSCPCVRQQDELRIITMKVRTATRITGSYYYVMSYQI